MGMRQRAWATKERQRLLATFGNCCARCHATEDLELDCIKPQGHEHHAMERSARMSFYRAQSRMGNLQALCRKCHAIKSCREGLPMVCQGEPVGQSIPF